MNNYEKHQIQEIKDNVFMENESRIILNKIVPIILAELKPYLNKKVLKIDNNLLKEIKDNSILNDLRVSPNPLKKGDNAKISYAYIDTSPYSLNLKLTICFNGGSYEDNSYYCYYYDTYIYLCVIKGENTIQEFKDYETKKMVNADEEIRIYQKAKKLKEELNEELEKFKIYKFRKMVK